MDKQRWVHWSGVDTLVFSVVMFLVVVMFTVGLAEANVYQITLLSQSEPLTAFIQWYSDTKPITKVITTKWIGPNGMETVIAGTGTHTIIIQEMVARPAPVTRPVVQPAVPPAPAQPSE